MKFLLTEATRGLGLLSALILLGAGCGSDPGNGSNGPRVLRLAHVYELNAPTHACGAAGFAEKIAAADLGLEVRVFPAAQLGSEAELLEQLVTGQLDMAIAGPSFLAAWHSPIGIFDAAYAFTSTDHLMQFAHGSEGEKLWEELRAGHGIRVLDTWFYGERHITSKKPVRQPEDLQGFRLRVPHARVWLATGEALGASPTPIPFAEVWLALQQGIVDGQENPIPTIKAMAFHEVQTHLNFTRHIQSSTQLLISERVWEKLNDEQRAALLETARAAGNETRHCIERDDKQILEEWRSTGRLEIIEDVHLDAFRERARRHFSQGFVFSPLYLEITGN
jgi:TRAP-type transport system periplasmic protein